MRHLIPIALVAAACTTPVKGTLSLEDGTEIDFWDGFLLVDASATNALGILLTNRSVECDIPGALDQGEVDPHVLEVDLLNADVQAGVHVLLANGSYSQIAEAPWEATHDWGPGNVETRGTLSLTGEGTTGEFEFRLPVCALAYYYE